MSSECLFESLSKKGINFYDLELSFAIKNQKLYKQLYKNYWFLNNNKKFETFNADD